MRSTGSRESPPKSATSASASKPKRVYHTKYKATVIVQSQTSRLTGDQTIDALQEALGRQLNRSDLYNIDTRLNGSAPNR